MEIVEWFLDKIFWGVVGGVSTAIWFKASYTCHSLGIGFACVEHPFNLMSAFGF